MTSSSPADAVPPGRWAAAERLLGFLNRWGPVWGAVVPADRTDCDCCLVSRDGSVTVGLRLVGFGPGEDGGPSPDGPGARAARLSAVVAGAGTGLDHALGAKPWLVVDAAGVPEAGMNAVRREVRGALHGQARFRQIWVVGHDPSQVWQAFGPPPADVTAPIW